MIILGIDPGTATTGWGVVRFIKPKAVFVDCGVVVTPANEKLEKRLATIFADVTQLINTHKPQVVAVEQLFFNTNVKTAISVGQARGVVLLAAEQKGLPVFSYTPLQVKVAVSGYGRADKSQVSAMVKNLLKLKEIPRPDDASDALAIALTHCFTSRLK